MKPEVFEAFRSIGVEEEKAVKAATALNAQSEEIAEIKSPQKLHSWMLGFILALLVATVMKLYVH